MQTNADKFISIMFRDPTNTDVALQINNVTRKRTELVKLLGAKIDGKLNFHRHISHLCRRSRYQLCTLSRFSGLR